MAARRDLVPFVVTLAAAASFVFAVARWSRPTTRRDVSPANSAPYPSSEPAAAQRDTSPLPIDQGPTRPSPPPPLPSRSTTAANTLETDAGVLVVTGVAAARAQLDALRARLDAIDVDAGGASAVTARRVLAGAAAPLIYEALGEGSEGFDARYNAYRASVVDGGAPEAARAQHLRPEDVRRAAFLDELSALLRPAP